MIGIVYSQATGRIRSLVYPDTDSELDFINAGPGEQMLKFDIAQIPVPDLPTLQQKLNAITGLVPSNDSYAVVDQSGNVVGAIIADPLCGDSLPGKQLVQNLNAQTLIGGTWDSKTGFVQKIGPISTDSTKVIAQEVI